ncbi:MAG: GNAT family N-acetyltransferase, partial [Desulfobacterales bacterium]
WNRRGILTCWLGDGTTQALRQLFIEKGVPSYETPSEAVRGFMQMYRYRHGQELLMETPPSIPGDFRPDTPQARQLVGTALEKNQEKLTIDQTMALLKAYRIPVAEACFAADPEAAARRAGEMSGPVVLDLSLSGLPAAGAWVPSAPGLDDPELVRETAAAMLEQAREETPDLAPDGFILRPMIDRTGCHELCLGMLSDSVFGPLIYFGQGGGAAPVLADQALALPPLNMKLARETISRTQIFRLLEGFSGRPAADIEAIAFTLVKLAQLIGDLPEIAAIDVNPLLADSNGVLVLDAVCRLQTPPAAARRQTAICAYPSHLEQAVSLPGGLTMLLRPVRPEDEPAFQDIFSNLSAEAIRFRFLHPKKILPHTEAARLTQIDYDRDMALVLAGKDAAGKPELYGSVRVIADPDNEDAEFAILLRGDMTGLGLGPMLMRRIIDYARSRGIRRLHGDVLDDNRPMLQVCKALGFKQKRDPDDPGVVRVILEVGCVR